MYVSVMHFVITLLHTSGFFCFVKGSRKSDRMIHLLIFFYTHCVFHVLVYPVNSCKERTYEFITSKKSMIDFVMNDNKELFAVSSGEHNSLSGGK